MWKSVYLKWLAICPTQLTKPNFCTGYLEHLPRRAWPDCCANNIFWKEIPNIKKEVKPIPETKINTQYITIVHGTVESSYSQILANSPKIQQIDSAQSHNTGENHKGHKFCVDRVRFGIFEQLWAKQILPGSLCF